MTRVEKECVLCCGFLYSSSYIYSCKGSRNVYERGGGPVCAYTISTHSPPPTCDYHIIHVIILDLQDWKSLEQNAALTQLFLHESIEGWGSQMTSQCLSRNKLRSISSTVSFANTSMRVGMNLMRSARASPVHISQIK